MTTAFCNSLLTAIFVIKHVDYVSGDFEGVPLAPSNLSIHTVRKHDVLIRWSYDGGFTRPVEKFEMTLWPEYKEKEYMNVQLLQLAKIEPYLRQVRIFNLAAGTMYVAYMTAVNEEGVSNRTENITFTTYTEAQLFHPVDTLVVLGVLCLWCFAVTAFLQRWGSIRIVQPRDTRYKFKPKNLETIRVCKRATDSVIYKNYSRQMSFTLEKREEKLERMNTLKQIQIETEQGIAREKDETLRQKGRILDKDERRHIVNMMEQKKRMKKQLKVHHKDEFGTPPPSRPRLKPKPGVVRGHPPPRNHARSNIEDIVRDDPKDECSKMIHSDEFREEDEDLELEKDKLNIAAKIIPNSPTNFRVKDYSKPTLPEMEVDAVRKEQPIELSPEIDEPSHLPSEREHNELESALEVVSGIPIETVVSVEEVPAELEVVSPDVLAMPVENNLPIEVTVTVENGYHDSNIVPSSATDDR